MICIILIYSFKNLLYSWAKGQEGGERSYVEFCWRVSIINEQRFASVLRGWWRSLPLPLLSFLYFMTGPKWALLTRSQYGISNTELTVKAHGPLWFLSIFLMVTYLTKCCKISFHNSDDALKIRDHFTLLEKSFIFKIYHHHSVSPSDKHKATMKANCC